ncbi:MAG: cysteine desulfurase family protein, partial [Candidatus Nomurabacteria bacterium]|nr:cysteine desulfurase family protein [Candidatus Nomurabacteria bacterium]
MFNKGKIYLDFASTTPIDERVFRLMSLYEKEFYANATSIHSSGVKVRNIIEKSRENIAKNINAHSDEIIFTGSSTESNAIAILGIVNNFKLNNNKIPHIITSEIEHPAVLMNCKLLESEGRAEVTYIKVDEEGIINPKDVKEAMKENTILISIMYANNEIGTIQPIEDIAKEIRHFKKGQKRTVLGEALLRTVLDSSNFPIFHTDATQAMNYLDTTNIEKLGVDLMSFNGSKIYGPKGIGALYLKRGVELGPLYSGGGQESGLRSGTENVASIAGLALALEITNKMKNKEVDRLTKLRDYAIDKLLNIKVGDYKIVFNGSKEVRLPNNINISISGITSELLVVELDAKGIEVSSKSACKSGEDNGHTLRITQGRSTTKAHLDKLIFILTK